MHIESNVESIERRLVSLFEIEGSSGNIGEPVTITHHSLQATKLASISDSKEVQLAALLHDIGHLLGLEAGFDAGMDGCGTVDHEGASSTSILRRHQPTNGQLKLYYVFFHLCRRDRCGICQEAGNQRNGFVLGSSPCEGETVFVLEGGGL